VILHLSETKQGHYYPENVEWHGTENAWGNGTTNNAWLQAANTQCSFKGWIWKHKGPPIYLLGECVGCTTHGCSFAMYSTVVVCMSYMDTLVPFHCCINYKITIKIINEFGCVSFVVSWSLLFPCGYSILNIEEKNNKQSNTTVSQ